MGTEAEQKLAMQGLQSASGFLQAKVAARLQTRTTPHLTFKRDVGIKRSIEMSKLIDEALAADRPSAEPDAEADAGPEPNRPTPRRRPTTATDPEADGPQEPGARPDPDRLMPSDPPRPRTLKPMATPSKTQFLTDVQALLKKRYKIGRPAEK